MFCVAQDGDDTEWLLRHTRTLHLLQSLCGGPTVTSQLQASNASALHFLMVYTPSHAEYVSADQLWVGGAGDQHVCVWMMQVCGHFCAALTTICVHICLNGLSVIMCTGGKGHMCMEGATVTKSCILLRFHQMQMVDLVLEGGLVDGNFQLGMKVLLEDLSSMAQTRQNAAFRRLFGLYYAIPYVHARIEGAVKRWFHDDARQLVVVQVMACIASCSVPSVTTVVYMTCNMCAPLFHRMPIGHFSTVPSHCPPFAQCYWCAVDGAPCTAPTGSSPHSYEC